jgi:hypothetical protein
MIGASDSHAVHNTLGAEELIEAIEIPRIRKKELFVLMKWQEPQNEIFGHDLPDHQVKIITEWIGRDRSSPRWVVQLIGMS